jgi:amphi-Trp domain-containing protein
MNSSHFREAQSRLERALAKQERDIEQTYALPEFIDKLRRLADSLEAGKRFDIQIAGERIYVPVRAIYTIEHERTGDEEEIEFQIKWEHDEGDEEVDEDDSEADDE